MFLLNKIFKFFKLLKYNLWRKGLLNGIAATIELENMVKDLDPETIGFGEPYWIRTNDTFLKREVLYQLS